MFVIFITFFFFFFLKFYLIFYYFCFVDDVVLFVKERNEDIFLLFHKAISFCSFFTSSLYLSLLFLKSLFCFFKYKVKKLMTMILLLLLFL